MGCIGEVNFRDQEAPFKDPLTGIRPITRARTGVEHAFSMGELS